MNRQDSINQLCFLVQDLSNFIGSTEDYVQKKLGKGIVECSTDELTDLAMEIVPNAH